MSGEQLIGDFAAGFRARVLAMRVAGQQLVEERGIIALIGAVADDPDGRALVTGDEALPVLRERGAGLAARVVNVFAAASRCHEFLTNTGDYRPSACVAMVHQDLSSVAATDLPEGLSLRPVIGEPGTTEGVALRDAAAAALRSDPSASPIDDLDGFVGYLRSVPGARYVAAVDAAGIVRATAAAAVFGHAAGVFFVNTDPAWRGRGVGTAMTAAALEAAAEAGARTACLDASALGEGLYLRLGFRPVSAATLFVRQG